MKFGTGSICLSKIPKEKITTGKDGLEYLNFVIKENKDGAIYYGNTHQVELSQTKEERDAKKEPVRLGNLKDWSVKDAPQPPSQVKEEEKVVIDNVPATEDNDDLPF